MYKSTIDQEMKGLWLSGNVIGRTKKINDDKSEIVIYRIDDGVNTYFVNHWNPKFYFELGNEVCLAITVKPYMQNNKSYLSYSIRQKKMIDDKF